MILAQIENFGAKFKSKYGDVSGVSSSCGARGGFLPRHDEDLREPLVRRQGSQVSMGTNAKRESSQMLAQK